MKSPSIDKLHAQLNKHILLVQSYTEVKDLEFIIKSCRLKPHSYVFEDKNEKIVLHRWWFDEFGNSLKIEGKTVKIIYNDLALEQDKIVCTDLYYGLSLEKIAKMSKLAHVFIGKDEDLLQDCFFLTFLGIDNYLRSYMFLQGEWQQVSPLLLGVKNLKRIARDLDIKYFLHIENKKNMPIPCFTEQEWLTFMPPSSDFLTAIGKQQENILPIFTKS